MKRIVILSLTLALGVVVALAVGSFLTPKPQPAQTAMAHWKNIYKTTGGLVAGADLIVTADHLWAEPGRVVGEGEDATPFTNNTFAVGSILKGVHEDSTLVLEQTGGVTADGAVFNINDGGPYQPGEPYLLFLKSKGDGTYYLINHQARYRIVDGFLEGVDPTDPVVARFNGMSLDRGFNVIEKKVRTLE
ncbi:MAG TPA: hypothetical protein VJH03_05955 [Blastocatellia bacterium]|nr:hypothetical protein [Blastocatellia bacterium]